MPKSPISFMEKVKRHRTKAHNARRGIPYQPLPKRKSPNRRRTKKVKKRRSSYENLSRGRRNRGKDRRRTAKQRKTSNRMVDAPSRRSKRPSVRRFADVVDSNLEFDRQQAAERLRKKSLKKQNKKDMDGLADLFGATNFTI
tara:strand:- start:672 stop:1097 length:426 start_codon:yes stop_codon:yes gene_type:complete